MRRIMILFAIIMILIVARVVFTAVRSGAGSMYHITSSGIERSYLVHEPEELHRTNLPVVLVFHGGLGKPRGIAWMTHMNEIADREHFIAVYPEGLDNHWNDGRETVRNKVNDVQFISDMLDRLDHDFHIDTHRIYAAGISNGGMFSQRLACELSDRIAAVASVAGTMPQAIRPDCKPAQPISILIMHGTTDPLVPYNGGEVRAHGRYGLGGTVISVADTVRFWVEHDGCTPAPVSSSQDKDPDDGTSLKIDVYSHGKDNSEVTLYTIVNGGHTWPGGFQYAPQFFIGKTSKEINASETIWNFFEPRRR